MPSETALNTLLKHTRQVLESPFWIPGLGVEELYTRLHDDHDGSHQGSVGVNIDRDGDAWVSVIGKRPGELIRFRTEHGGGQSPRVRAALMILAYAIQLDNKERPQE